MPDSRSVGSTLFRSQASTYGADRLIGDIGIVVPVRWKSIGFFLFSIVSVGLVFISSANYARVETVLGTIKPDTGVVPTLATRAGVISELSVKDGQVISIGATLATIRAEEDGASPLAPGALVEAAIARQDASLAMQLDASFATAEAQIAQLAAQRGGLMAEIEQLRLQKEAQAGLITTAEEDLRRATEIAANGFVSKRDLQVREEALLSRQQGMAQLNQALAAKRAALAENVRSSAVISAQARSQSASLEVNRAQVAQQAASASASRAYVLRASVAGRVTALTARVGQPVSPGVQLMSIVPTSSQLTAELAVPSAAIGFVKPGQDVRLALDAFPYQRFGTVKGRIRTVPASTVNTQSPNGSIVPVYPVIVDIESPQVSAYGRDEPLVAGMNLTARIITEKQSLLEWLFEPLFAVRQR